MQPYATLVEAFDLVVPLVLGFCNVARVKHSTAGASSHRYGTFFNQLAFGLFRLYFGPLFDCDGLANWNRGGRSIASFGVEYCSSEMSQLGNETPLNLTRRAYGKVSGPIASRHSESRLLVLCAVVRSHSSSRGLFGIVL